MSEEMVLPAGMNAAPAPSAMMQIPATEMLRPRARPDILASSLVAITVPAPATPRIAKGFLAGRQHLLHAARRLTQALLILDERDADIAFALLAEADAGSHRDLRLGQ